MKVVFLSWIMNTQGLEVIDKIAKVQKDRYDRPVEDVKMTISIVE